MKTKLESIFYQYIAIRCYNGNIIKYNDTVLNNHLALHILRINHYIYI